ncbi:MAG: glycoside hydrolase family 30 protein [Fibrobacterota bacterium]
MSEAKPIRVFQTARDTRDRLTFKGTRRFSGSHADAAARLLILYPEVVYQTIEGFGGAFTEAGAVTLQKLSTARRNEILRAYFHPKTGLGYSLCRTHINSCDFSTGNYAYVEDPADTKLKTFSITRDEAALIPFIKGAQKVPGANFRMFASPWSPPAWMKTNHQMNQGGKLQKKYAAVWAEYYAKYIAAYAKKGIKIWGLTVQNEPKAVQKWDSCVYSAEEERNFVRDHLGPVLKKRGLGHVKIMVWDHNKERVYGRAKVILSDPKAAKYVWGVAFHWYSGDHFENLSIMDRMFPGVKLLFSEGCVEKAANIGKWENGERYGHHIIGDLNHGAVGWVDWNLLLDEKGGPNHVGNYCDAPIIADTRKNKILYESSYYYIGHFSRFIRPGARRIGCSRYTDKLEAAAFRNRDGSLITVVLNRTDEALAFILRLGHQTSEFTSLPHSMMTLVC